MTTMCKSLHSPGAKNVELGALVIGYFARSVSRFRESPPSPTELPQWRFWLRSPGMPRLWGWNAVWVVCGLMLALLVAQNLYRRHPLPVKTATDPKPPQSAIPATRPGNKSAFNSKAIIQSDPRNGQTTATDGPAIVQRLDVRPNVDGLTIQIVCNVPVTPRFA